MFTTAPHTSQEIALRLTVTHGKERLINYMVNMVVLSEYEARVCFFHLNKMSKKNNSCNTLPRNLFFGIKASRLGM